MPRARNPNRERAFQIWLDHNGGITNRQIAEMIDENEKVVAVWKQRDKWKVVQQSDESCTTIEKGGTSPPGQGNGRAVKKDEQPIPKQPPNQGGAPLGNSNAVTHGLYRKHLPASINALIDEVRGVPPLDVIYEMIYIDFAKIIEAMRLMHVQHKDDHLRLVKKKKWNVGGKVDKGDDSDDGAEAGILSEIEYEVYIAPEQQASQMKALATVQAALRANIKMFMELSGADDKRRLELAQMEASLEKTRAEVEKLKEGAGGGDRTQIIDDIGGDIDGGSA